MARLYWPALLAVIYHGQVCLTADICKSNDWSNATQLDSGWSRSSDCGCNITVSRPTTLYLSFTMMEEREESDDGHACRPLIYVDSATTRYFVCATANEAGPPSSSSSSPSGSNTSREMSPDDVFRIHISNANNVRIRTQLNLQVSRGTIHYKCSSHNQPLKLSFCPCMSAVHYPDPMHNKINVIKRFGVGFASVIIFLLVFGGIVALFIFYKRRKSAEQSRSPQRTSVAVITRVAPHRLSNPDLYASPPRKSSHIYADLHLNNELPFTPDPTLDLSLRSVSRESNLYSEVREPAAAAAVPGGVTPGLAPGMAPSLNSSRPSTPPLATDVTDTTYAIPRRKHAGTPTQRSGSPSPPPSPLAPRLAPRMYSEVYVSLSDMGTTDSGASANASQGTIETDI